MSPQHAFDTCRQSLPVLRVEPLAERRKRLKSLRRWIHENRNRIHDALYADLRKPSMETDATEIFHVLNEIRTALKSLDRWTAPGKVSTPFFMPGTRAWIRYEPRGLCLIISPWNYPFSLAIGPLISALAAGNAVILKPSEITPSVSALLAGMCRDIFEPAVVSVCEGGAEVSQQLLALPFDHVFFTGSPTVGKIVMRAAAEHLASVTLELGGKSPAIVSADARLDDAAERIAVGKFINNGQTCIAPDYVLAEKRIMPQLVQKLIEKTSNFYARDTAFDQSDDYGRIVNEAHFVRIEELLNDALSRGAKIEWGGKRDRASRFMHPVILTGVPPESRIMEEEIFGPVLPVIPYEHIDEALTIVRSKPKPLALYVFTGQKRISEKTLREIPSGTACINDCAIQFLHHNLPFGGINNSGMGKAHGYFGFLAFSNDRPVLKQKSGFTAIRPFYPPFSRRTKQLMDWFLRLF